MDSAASSTRGNIIPSVRYHDAPAAIEWLCKVFGFEKNLVVPGEEGKLIHAQLVLGNGMVMIGSGGGHGGPFDELVAPASERDAVRAQSVYIVVDGIDGHYERAMAGGAEIVIDNQDADYGGRGYTCRDLEGNVWSFGSYDPWAEVDAS